MTESPRGLAILGSTGSIGCSTLDVVRSFPDRFRIVTLAAGRKADELLEQARELRPRFVAVASEKDAARLRRELPPEVEVGSGPSALVDAAVHDGVDVVVGAVVGAAGLPSAIAAVRSGRTLALANKETLVVAGDAVMAAARKSGAAVLPIDSEHNAIHQALRGGTTDEVERILLTASGGPFRTRELSTFGAITVDDALAHPTWRMGPKITIDSATMMNKGLEVIEAHHLFGLPGERIDVVLHPQSLVHSMVEYRDGSLLAQLSVNDMRFPILYALSFPERLRSPFGRLDFAVRRSLEFLPVEPERYPCLGLARAALAAGGSAPAVLNGANEVAVAAFLEGRIPFPAIGATVGAVLDLHLAAPGRADDVDEAISWDAFGRREAERLLPQGALSR